MDLTLLHADHKAELGLRLEKIRYEMEPAETDAILVGTPTNLYYTAGGVFRGYVYIPLDRDPLFLLMPPSECDSRSECDTTQVRGIRKPEMIPDVLKAEGYPMPSRLGLEMQDMSYSDVTRLMKVFHMSECRDATPVLRRARACKTPYELELMRQDGLRQAAVYSQIKHCYSEDMTDLEFQIEIERVLRRAGCLGYPRVAGMRMQINLGSVIAGPNADRPSPYDFSMGGAGIDPSLPVGASGELMKYGTAVMVDMNGGFNGYQTDMTRCWTVGDIPEVAQRAHECSIAILRDLESLAKPGVPAGKLHERAEELAREAGLEKYFMGHRHKVAFIGHGVGIELNEMPVIMIRNREPLLRHMTLALEPKFVIPEVGAVGVENTYEVTDNGLRNLTVLDEELKQL